ncbi:MULTISPECIES: SLAC1 anion channel family protein [unclassified Halomonas]|uniref:SLAC1 anion channel family protein n=1 Tax=unclassified Halomonas TaxID=2609666 RepID=UPI0007F0FE70|nr:MULTISPECIES: SLAC1 anion channel family protein [unclassified Halomonas]SBR51551.1 tellurite resistance protein [Halomonas sp. HL-93]SNY97402.1 tellurite resistance protein [Halomonas sp. hl-4]
MTKVRPSRLQNFPISWFATVMGMTGFTIAWHRAEDLLGLSVKFSPILLGLTGVTFVVLLVLYLTKALKYPGQVKAEFAHPVKVNFFPTISIGLILLSIALLPYSNAVSFTLWSVGVVLHLGFTLYVLSAWLHQTHFEIAHINPAWFIPIVGNILVPIAGAQHASMEISWFFFSIGLVFWVVLLTIIFYRMFFHQPLPSKLLPTLFILIAPPAVGFISWFQLVGEINPLGRILYYFALFMTLMLLTQTRRFLKLEFFLSWWAYSFPMAAITIASFLMYEQLQLPFFKGLSVGLLGLLTGLIGILVIKTAQAVRAQAICIQD